mmetsp:Transcript_33041/g.75516  ORF Transcript_33041/g.75516 Transcript_33041/m.75516 type:complete len:260 (-) Transcript_33041:408-1187(-)
MEVQLVIAHPVSRPASKHTQQDRSQRSGSPVDPVNVEGVVDVEALLRYLGSVVGEQPAEKPNRDCGLSADKARGRRDTCQARENPVEHGGRGRAMVPHGQHEPHHTGHTCCDVSADDSRNREVPSVHRRTAVEAKPSHPQESGTNARERDVRRGRFAHVLQEIGARAQEQRDRQRPRAGGGMDHDAARVVQHAPFGEEPPTPDPVHCGVVNQDFPEEGEDEECLPSEALRVRAGHDERRDRGEHHLEERMQRGGDVGCV